jgi:nucleoside-diphosphate-sugar epimerase
MVGDPSAIRAAVGWANEISLEQALTDILDYWEKELR